MIRTWTKFKLIEFHTVFMQMYDVLDDWIVIAVEKENEQAQEIIRNLKEHIISKSPYLDHFRFKVDTLELINEVNTIEFYSQIEVPHRPSLDMLQSRFSVENLRNIYNEFRFYSYEEYLDSQTLIHLIVLNFKRGRIPTSWRYEDFGSFMNWTKKFKTKPLGVDSSPLYQRAETRGSQREFVNWKKIFTYFVLLEAGIPDRE